MTASIISVFLAGVAIGTSLTSLGWQRHNARVRNEVIKDCLKRAETIQAQRR